MLATMVIPRPDLGRFFSVSSSSLSPRGGVSCATGEERDFGEARDGGEEPLLEYREAISLLERSTSGDGSLF